MKNMRSDGKLPRGSFFYITVGHRFYGGEAVEIKEIQSDPSRFIPLSYYDKGRKPSRDFLRYQRENWYNRRSRGDQSSRARRDARKKTTATYAKAPPRVERVTIKEFTGVSMPRLVDSVDEAKRFRHQSRADSACERLRVCYKDIDVKISIHCYKEKSSEHPSGSQRQDS
jgi:hypothetical protein